MLFYYVDFYKNQNIYRDNNNVTFKQSRERKQFYMENKIHMYLESCFIIILKLHYHYLLGGIFTEKIGPRMENFPNTVCPDELQIRTNYTY